MSQRNLTWCAFQIEQKARRAAQKVVRWREECVEPEVFERVSDVIVEPPIALVVDWHLCKLPEGEPFLFLCGVVWPCG